MTERGCTRHVPGFGHCGLPAAEHQPDRLNHPYEHVEPETTTAAPGWPLMELEHRLDEIGRDLAGKAAYAMVKGQTERQNALLAASSLIDDVINDLQELPDGT